MTKQGVTHVSSVVLTISAPEAAVGRPLKLWRFRDLSCCWTCLWLNSSSMWSVSSSYSPSVLSDVQMLCFPITLCLGRVSQLKLRILEFRVAPLAKRPPPCRGGGRPGAGGRGGGGGGGSGGGGGGGMRGPPGCIFCQGAFRRFRRMSCSPSHTQAGWKPIKFELLFL